MVIFRFISVNRSTRYRLKVTAENRDIEQAEGNFLNPTVATRGFRKFPSFALVLFPKCNNFLFHLAGYLEDWF